MGITTAKWSRNSTSGDWRADVDSRLISRSVLAGREPGDEGVIASLVAQTSPSGRVEIARADINICNALTDFRFPVD